MYRSSMYNSARLPALINYENAKAHYENVVPIRGRYPEERPLGKNRRYQHMQIHKRVKSVEVEGDPLGKFVTTYACQLYSTDCIEFFPDESIVLRVNSWKGPTTMMFLNYTLENFGRIESASGKWYFVNKGGEAFTMPTAKGQELRLHFVDGHGFIPTELKPEYKYTMRRKEMNRLRKYYGDFIEYGKTMLMADGNLGGYEDFKPVLEKYGFAGHRFTGNEVYSRWDNDGNKQLELRIADERNKLMKFIELAMDKNDLEMKYDLMRLVSWESAWYSYRSSRQSIDPARFCKAVDELIKYHHRDTVFEPIEQEIGVPFDDRNEKYFYPC